MRISDWSSDVCSSDLQEGEEYAGAGVSVDNDENEDGPAGGMSSKQLEHLRTKSLKKFENISVWFSKMRTAFERDGYQAQEYAEAQEAILNELMGVRFTAKMVEKLADTLREQVAQVRKLERTVQIGRAHV